MRPSFAGQPPRQPRARCVTLWRVTNPTATARRRARWLVPLVALLCFFALGRWLDHRSEARILARYPRDAAGVIQGLAVPPHEAGRPEAVILLHGIMESPQVFEDLSRAIVARAGVDLYTPLFPSHGRDLQSAARLDNDEVRAFVDRTVRDVASRHRRVLLLGLSYGGVHTIDAMRRNTLPQNVTPVLLAPAVHTLNASQNRVTSSILGLWRTYCDVAAFGCSFPVYQSGDETARPFLEREKNLQHVVLPAVRRVIEIDEANREYFARIDRPHTLIIARDDNRVSYDEQARACRANARCTLIEYPSGRHLLLHSAHRERVTDEILARIAAMRAS